MVLPTPVFIWSNRQRVVSSAPLSLPVVRAVVAAAWPSIREAERGESVLGQLGEIGFVLVSDARIAALHQEFLNNPSPTDVITFPHGEIVISVETAKREAQQRALSLPEEIARYAVHGMLHLAGWSDATPRSGAAMRAIQEKILRRALRGLC
jgi:probable rRNA maturation factor